MARTLQNSHGGRDLEQIAGGWVGSKRGHCCIFFLKDSGNVPFFSNIVGMDAIVFFPFLRKVRGS